MGSIALTRSCDVRHSRSTCSRRPRRASSRSAAPVRWSSSRSSRELIRRSAATTARLRASVGCAVSTRWTRSEPSSSARCSGPGVVADLGDRGGQRLAHRLAARVAFPQVTDALMLFGQVGQVEVDGEGPGHLLGRLQAPGRDQLGDLVPGRIGAPGPGAGIGPVVRSQSPRSLRRASITACRSRSTSASSSAPAESRMTSPRMSPSSRTSRRIGSGSAALVALARPLALSVSLFTPRA